MKRHIIVKITLLVVYFALAVTMFVTGRTHTVLLDNRDAEDGSCTALSGITLTVNGGDAFDFAAKARDLISVKGQTAKIHVEFKDGTPTKSFDVEIPFKEDSVMISIPKLVAGLDAVVPFEM